MPTQKIGFSLSMSINVYNFIRFVNIYDFRGYLLVQRSFLWQFGHQRFSADDQIVHEQTLVMLLRFSELKFTCFFEQLVYTK